jgi:hypothetical protein
MGNIRAVVSLAKKLKPKFVGNNPTQIYDKIRNDRFVKMAVENLDGRDYIILIFMLANDKNVDLTSLYTVIDYNLFAVVTGLVNEVDPEVECQECGGTGDVQCTECYGDGNFSCNTCEGSGEVECGDCGGDGVDSDGETCDNCSGDGNETCNDCGGDGELNCSYCYGSGNESCGECDSGYVTEFNKQNIEMFEIISYDKNFREKFHNSINQIFEPDYIYKIINTNLFLEIRSDNVITDDYVGDVELNDEFLIDIYENFSVGKNRSLTLFLTNG